jgi:hypothetical protein
VKPYIHGKKNGKGMAEEGSIDEAKLAEDVRRRESEVNSLLTRKDKARALLISLQSPPSASKNAEVKDANAATVEKVLSALTEAEIGAVVEALDLEACDTLMKYLYRFMAGSFANNALLLKLHAAVWEKAGNGAIIRSMTDRKQV